MTLTDKTIDWPTPELLHDLLVHRSRACVSIYIPTHRMGRETQQGPIRLKNLLRRAADELKTRGMRDSEIDAALNPAREKAVSYEFWQFQSDGLAVFLSPEFHAFFRLPIPFAESAQVGERFLIKPLLPAVARNGRFHILALGQSKVRLFRCGHHTIEEVTPHNTPDNFADFLKRFEFEASIQQRAGGAGPKAGHQDAIFHGQGGMMDGAVIKHRIMEFYKEVETGVRAVLGSGNQPLILAGHDFLQGIYRLVDHYRFTAAEGLEGNAEDAAPEALHERASALIAAKAEERKRADIDHFHKLMGRGDGRAAGNLRDVVAAAAAGRIETLLIRERASVFGHFNEGDFSIRTTLRDAPGAEDLIDLTAALTLRAGGAVLYVSADETDNFGDVGAIMRF